MTFSAGAGEAKKKNVNRQRAAERRNCIGTPFVRQEKSL
jgi:hypothetical protein